MKNGKKGYGHGNPWFAGVIGIILAVILYIHLPAYKAISGVVFIFALAHLIIAGIVLISAYLISPQKLKNILFEKRRMKKMEGKLYFGWSIGWMNMFWVLGVIFLIASVMIYSLNSSFIWLALIFFLESIILFIGNIYLQCSKKLEFMTLPYVDLLKTDKDLILDAGCGSGRTTVALSKVMKNSKIVAFDRFDSDYIDKGGRSLLERNLKIAGISDKVDIIQGDVTEMNFKDNYFDSAISTYMMDHLGKNKFTALKEIQRVLKPGGKFLLVVFVPNWATFSVFNVLCFSLTSKKGWRDLFIKTGFKLKDEGAINGGVYFLTEKL
jgi:SAM-dependent methyltransferase